MSAIQNISFAVQKATDGSYPSTFVDIFIDQIDIRELLKIYELSYATKEGHANIAGQYGGLTPNELYKELTTISPDKKTIILGCECGEIGCWPMMIDIEKQHDTIIRKNFEQPHRTKDSHNFWNYHEFGALHFDSTQYYDQIDTLKEHFLLD